MAASCPNRTRHKRPVGGGSPSCRGHLVADLTVRVRVPMKSMRDPGSIDRSLRKYTMRYGLRVTPADLAVAWRSRGTRLIRCDTCDFSFNVLQAAVAPARKGRTASTTTNNKD